MRAGRIVGVADTDSYVKWAAALLGTLTDGVAELVVLDTELVVSDAQLAAALAGSGLPAGRVRRAGFDELPALVDGADAVLVAARGPLVRVVAREVASLTPRPVLVTGLPGISVPATWLALHFRRQCDLFVLHAHREIRAFRALAHRRGIAQDFALARLPFARAAEGAGSDVDAADGAAGNGGARGGGVGDGSASDGAEGDRPSGRDLVFAGQAIVPHEREDRVRIARALVEAARADPSRRVVVKLRGAAGEKQTHEEHDAYPGLIRALGPVPRNLVFSTAPMGEALETAEGLVTVSSTAAVEAIARGVPVIAIDDFGVSARLINLVFEGSGVFGGLDDVVRRAFRRPDAAWLRENYFHPAEDDDWTTRLDELVERRRAGGAPGRPPYARWGGRARDAWERRLALGTSDRSLAGAVAYAVGVPVREILRAARRARRDRGRQQPGPAGSSRQVDSTSAVCDSTTRTVVAVEETVTSPSTG
ncbi:DUF6716 putative glycosyltransferase [Microbacterium gilvum]|uniref:Glycosyltransferase n=1 Tax=Microbacterium gilvum TaxID=1336204 RepID=A0ABP8ZP74_9MICO